MERISPSSPASTAQSTPPRVLIIAGPTASGKKALALAAAERFGGEIVSVDSRKVYRLLDIGAAKPSPADRERIPHHLIDIVDPGEPFSAGDWVLHADRAVRDILSRGKLPILSGGTGFYLAAFLDGLSEGIEASPAIREKLRCDLDTLGPDALYRRLAEIDPERAGELNPRDSFRVLRALEVFETTGRTFTAHRSDERIRGIAVDPIAYVVTRDRDDLHTRIDRRVDEMVASGLIDELAAILDRYPRDIPALDTVGYKEWFPFLDGAASFEACLADLKRNTRRYAKRQLTWFRARPGFVWVDLTPPGAFDATLDDIAARLASPHVPVPSPDETA